MRSIINKYNWKYIWDWWRLPLLVVALILAGWFIYGCTPEYPFTPVTFPQESEFKDPLAIDRKQRESIATLTDRFGDPELLFSYADEDFKIEILRWKKPGKHERFAIRINNVYKFTWTQFNVEKENKGVKK